MKLVLASNNAGKLAELQALFAPLGVQLVRQADLGKHLVAVLDGLAQRHSPHLR